MGLPAFSNFIRFREFCFVLPWFPAVWTVSVTSVSRNILSAHSTGATHSAGSSHLPRILFRAVVGGDIAAVIGISPVTAQRGISVSVTGEIQFSAVNGQ